MLLFFYLRLFYAFFTKLLIIFSYVYVTTIYSLWYHSSLSPPPPPPPPPHPPCAPPFLFMMRAPCCLYSLTPLVIIHLKEVSIHLELCSSRLPLRSSIYSWLYLLQGCPAVPAGRLVRDSSYDGSALKSYMDETQQNM